MRACRGSGLSSSLVVSNWRVTEVPYSADSSRRFAAFVRLPWCVFLDSGRPRVQQGRYDILAADPYMTLTTRGLTTEIRTRHSVQVSDGDPFLLLRHHLGEPVDVPASLPFTGGAIGYFAYDLGRRLERLPSFAKHDVSMPDLAIGLYDWAVVVDHAEKRAWLVAQGRDECSFDRWQSLVETMRSNAAVGIGHSFKVLSPITANLDRRAYADAFQRIKRYIREGDCYQVNLAQRFSARAEGEPWDAYTQLRELNPAPFSAFMQIPGGAVLSSSPERFLRVYGNQVETRPIKGTRPRSPYKQRDRALAEELRNSPKDQAENLMIVDLLRNDLGKNCVTGSIEVPQLFALESFATVHHLVSTVTGHLADGKHPLDLLAGCFPGGSITGAPKLRAMEIIEELEPHRRSVYCGAIGYIGFDRAMDTNIAIRTLVYNDGYLHAWAGGGIVVDSDLDAEYQESLDKAAAMLKLLQGQEAFHVGS